MSIHNLTSLRFQQKNIPREQRETFTIPGWQYTVQCQCQNSQNSYKIFFADGQTQHKIMNFKLEDFDMVKTIGTGKKIDLCHFILGIGVSQNMCFIVSHTFMDARFFLKSVTQPRPVGPQSP